MAIARADTDCNIKKKTINDLFNLHIVATIKQQAVCKSIAFDDGVHV